MTLIHSQHAGARRLLGIGPVGVRIVHFGVVILAVYTLAFFLLYALPGDPVALMLTRRSAGAGAIDPAQLTALRSEYGLDGPLVQRYATTLADALTGDLGVSFQSGRPVPEVITAAAPNTARLAALALVLAVPFAAALAVLASWHRDRMLHRFLQYIPALISAVPAFWLGLVLLQVFVNRLRWFPPTGVPGIDGLVLPAITLALPVSAVLAAVLIRSLDDIQDSEFVAVLRSRGLPWHRVYLAHVLRNALLPFVTLTGLTVGGVLTGTVVTETVFARSGLGRLLVSSVQTQDAPVVLGITILAAIAFATVNLGVDLLYPALDPRMRHPASRGAR